MQWYPKKHQIKKPIYIVDTCYNKFLFFPAVNNLACLFINTRISVCPLWLNSKLLGCHVPKKLANISFWHFLKKKFFFLFQQFFMFPHHWLESKKKRTEKNVNVCLYVRLSAHLLIRFSLFPYVLLVISPFIILLVYLPYLICLNFCLSKHLKISIVQSVWLSKYLIV